MKRLLFPFSGFCLAMAGFFAACSENGATHREQPGKLCDSGTRSDGARCTADSGRPHDAGSQDVGTPESSADADADADAPMSRADATTDAGGCPPEPTCIEQHLAAPPSFPSCLFASPLAVQSQGKTLILVVPQRGPVTAVSPDTGEVAFEVPLPVPDGELPSTFATPVVADGRVFVAYFTAPEGADRESQRVAVVNLEQRALDPEFPVVVLEASKPTWDGTGQVLFRDERALSRAALVWAKTSQKPEGFVYVTFGNAQDIQPWHGWAFELDVAAWRTQGAAAATSAVLLTTAEDYCPVEGQSGSRDMICGGGIWAPSGPVVVPDDTGDTFELIIPTGNGLLDLSTAHYANSILRTGPGLTFDPGCDPTLCADFSPTDPAEACMASCEDIFMPRLMAGDPPLTLASGVCDGKTLLECYAALDYDLGANSPALVELGDKRLWVLPGKDGAVYLFDADHMGTLYDREVVIEQCGTVEDPCTTDWAGMMVTQPKIVQIDGEIRALVPTFIFDHTHPAGLVSLAVVDGPDGPQFEPRWQAPDFDSDEARTRFRRHPSRLTVVEVSGRTYAAWVDVVASANGKGTLLVARADTGEIVFRVPLVGKGRRFIEPLFHDGVLWTTSCNDNAGPGLLESFRFTP